MNYKKLYLKLFNAITDALRAMERYNYGMAAEILKKAQCEAEALYIDQAEAEAGEQLEKRAG